MNEFTACKGPCIELSFRFSVSSLNNYRGSCWLVRVQGTVLPSERYLQLFSQPSHNFGILLLSLHITWDLL